MRPAAKISAVSSMASVEHRVAIRRTLIAATVQIQPFLSASVNERAGS
jgi:hypothetical protein